MTRVRDLGIYQLPGVGRVVASHAMNADEEGNIIIGGALYTVTEWNAVTVADYEWQSDGSIIFQGEPTDFTTDDLVDTGQTADQEADVA